MNEPTQDRSRMSFDDAFGILWFFVFAIHCWAAVMHLLLRVPGTCGKDYFGIMAFCGWLWLLVYTQVFFPQAPGAIYVWYIFLGLLPLLIVHRIAAMRARRKGLSVHSHYIGKSWTECLFPFLKPSTCKPAMELVVCVLAGFGLMTLSLALGTFILFGGFASAFQMDLIEARDRRKIDAMEDAIIEQEYLAEALQERLQQRERNRS